MTFEKVLPELKAGKKAIRQEWGGSEEYIFGTLSNSVDGPWNSILKVEFFFYTLIASLKCWGVWLGPAGSVARRPQPHKFTENFLYLL